MRKSASLLFVLLAALLLPAILFATGNRQQQTSTAGRNDPVTITYFRPLHVSNNEEQFRDSPGLDRLREKTGVTIQWRLIPGGSANLQTEAFNLMMASGDITDVVGGTIDTELKLYPQAWATLDDRVPPNASRYPSLNRIIFQDDYLKVYLPEDDGHWRYIPFLASRRFGDTLIVRQDLLTAWGMRMPVTLSDWEAALRRAKQEGYMPYKTRQQRGGILNGILTGYMDAIKEDYFEENGQIKYGVLDPRLREAVEIARRWYAEGLIDPEYPSTQAARWQEDVLRGDVFATRDNIQRVPWANNEYINTNVSYRMIGAPPMQSPRTGRQISTDHYPKVRAPSAAIYRNARNIDRILDFFEYCYSDEGFILMNFGIEGFSFDYVDGVPRLRPDYPAQAANGTVKHVITIIDQPKVQKDELYFDYEMDREDHRSLRATRDMYANGDFIKENWIASISFNDTERATLAPIQAELNTYRSEMLDKFIMGIEPMSNWDAFVAQIQRMNLQTAINVYQTALRRVLR